MSTYRITPEIVLTIGQSGGRFLPSDMQGTRHPHAWQRQKWHYSIAYCGDSIISGSDLETNSGTSSAEAAKAVASFMSAEADRYRHAHLGQSEPPEGWIFDGAEQSEFCYLYDDEFALFAEENLDSAA